jgi:hypothetical protein
MRAGRYGRGRNVLYLRYTIDTNKLSGFAEYATREQIPIRESGGKILGYFLPTDFAGATGEAFGLIDFPSLAEYEIYRANLAAHRSTNEMPLSSKARAPCYQSNGHLIQRVEPAEELQA